MKAYEKAKPRARLFDPTERQPDFAVALLSEQPGLLWIGVDAASNELLVLCSRPAQALSVEDLIGLT